MGQDTRRKANVENDKLNKPMKIINALNDINNKIFLYPLQLINEPIAPDSLQLKPAKYLAANIQPPNLPTKAENIIAMVYAQVIPNRSISNQYIAYKQAENECTPLFNKPRSVERPERVKYCMTRISKRIRSWLRATHERKEDDGNHILQFFRHCNRKATFAWYNESSYEGAYRDIVTKMSN